VEAIAAGLNDQEGFFLEGAGASGGIGEIVSWLMDH